MTTLERVETPVAAGGPFSGLTAGLIVLAGVFAFCALAVLLAYAPDLRRGDNGEAHALSSGAVGYAGLAKALRLAGDPVVINRAPLPQGARHGLLVVTPPVGAHREAVDAFGFKGPVLVVLPKWATAPDPRHQGWVRKVQLIDPSWFPAGSLPASAGVVRRQGLSRPVLSASGVGGPFQAGVRLAAGPVDSLQAITAPGWKPVLVDQSGAVILARAPDAPLYVLADPDLLDTQGLAHIDTLATALTLIRTLRAGEGPVIFDVRLNGFTRERGLLRLLLEPPFLAVTLCLAAAAALAGWQAFCRFGPARAGGRTIPLGKAALVENTAALIRLAGREPRMGGRYADLTVALAARAVGAPRGLGEAGLAAFLDRLGARRGLGAGLDDLDRRARTATTAEGLTAAARKLYDWRRGLAGPDVPNRPPERRDPP